MKSAEELYGFKQITAIGRSKAGIEKRNSRRIKNLCAQTIRYFNEVKVRQENDTQDGCLLPLCHHVTMSQYRLLPFALLLILLFSCLLAVCPSPPVFSRLAFLPKILYIKFVKFIYSLFFCLLRYVFRGGCYG